MKSQIKLTNKWFQTWNRIEYKEWALTIDKGYRLLIIRKEIEKFLCVKANLIMGDVGLPAFEVIQEKYFSDLKQAAEQIYTWSIEEK